VGSGNGIGFEWCKYGTCPGKQGIDGLKERADQWLQRRIDDNLGIRFSGIRSYLPQGTSVVRETDLATTKIGVPR